MKVKFAFYGSEHEIWANLYNVEGQNIMAQPNISKLTFVSLDGAVKVEITIDERNRLAEVLAHGMQNEIFEFDFEQPIPTNRLNP